MSHSHMTEDGTYEPISVGAQVGHYFLFAAACALLRATRFVLTLPSQSSICSRFNIRQPF